MALIASRKHGETWREAVVRRAGQYGLVSDCLAVFDNLVQKGASEDLAAWAALYEWDLLDFEPDWRAERWQRRENDDD